MCVNRSIFIETHTSLVRVDTANMNIDTITNLSETFLKIDSMYSGMYLYTFQCDATTIIRITFVGREFRCFSFLSRL